MLTIERTPLQDSLRRMRKLGKQSSEPVCLEFRDEALTITWAGSSEQIPARGQWPVAVHVPAGWIRALARVLPPADPLTIRVDAGREITESLSVTAVEPQEKSELISAQDRMRRIAKAASALKGFRILEDDLEYLMDRCESERRHPYHPAEDNLL